LTSFKHKLAFLIDIQIAIFDQFHERLSDSLEAYLRMTTTLGRAMGGVSREEQDKLLGIEGLESLCRTYGSADYLEKAMRDWSDDVVSAHIPMFKSCASCTDSVLSFSWTFGRSCRIVLSTVAALAPAPLRPSPNAPPRTSAQAKPTPPKQVVFSTKRLRGTDVYATAASKLSPRHLSPTCGWR
jgi:hypothetical protein